MFTGGSLSSMAIFGLGIMPYITASIVFQLLTAIVPALSRIAHEGPTGRKRINQYVRVSTVFLCLMQAAMLCHALVQATSQSSEKFISPGVAPWEMYMFVIVSLTVGTMFLMWLGEQIDEFGIGNGISLLIMAGILSRLPKALHKLFGNFGADAGASVEPWHLMCMALIFGGMTLAVVMITLGTRRVPVMQSKAMRGRKMYGGQRSFLPLKVNQANVIPIIFAQAIMQVVAWMAGFAWAPLGMFLAPGSFWYTIIYVLHNRFFCYIYTAIQFNPKEMADNLNQSGMYIPGIRPGKRTAEHLGKIMTRIALSGGIFLAGVAIVPQFISNFLGVDYDISGMMGGTGLLIVVGVALDVVQRIESYLLMRNYEGFGVAGGRIRGRRG
jgi:preprotein translocase subunit SecY